MRMLHLKIRISCEHGISLSKNAILGYTAKALRIKTLRSIPLAFRAVSSGGERFPDTEEVTSSNLVTPTIRGHGSVGRAPPCQGGGRGFEPRCPLHL